MGLGGEGGTITGCLPAATHAVLSVYMYRYVFLTIRHASPPICPQMQASESLCIHVLALRICKASFDTCSANKRNDPNPPRSIIMNWLYGDKSVRIQRRTANRPKSNKRMVKPTKVVASWGTLLLVIWFVLLMFMCCLV